MVAQDGPLLLVPYQSSKAIHSIGSLDLVDIATHADKWVITRISPGPNNFDRFMNSHPIDGNTGNIVSDPSRGPDYYRFEGLFSETVLATGLKLVAPKTYSFHLPIDSKDVATVNDSSALISGAACIILPHVDSYDSFNKLSVLVEIPISEKSDLLSSISFIRANIDLFSGKQNLVNTNKLIEMMNSSNLFLASLSMKVLLSNHFISNEAAVSQFGRLRSLHQALLLFHYLHSYEPIDYDLGVCAVLDLIIHAKSADDLIGISIGAMAVNEDRSRLSGTSSCLFKATLLRVVKLSDGSRSSAFMNQLLRY